MTKLEQAEQQAITPESGAVYAELPEHVAEVVDPNTGEVTSMVNESVGFGDCLFTVAQMRDFADHTHALRMEQAAPKAAPGVQNTVPAEWLEQAYREGWAACRDAETIGEEAEDWAFGNSTANSRMIDAQQAAPQQEHASPISVGWGRDYLDNGKPIDASVAPVPNLALAPQQEAQEPVAWRYNRLGSCVNPWFKEAGREADDLRVGRWDTIAGLYMKPSDNHVDWTPLYAAPQPAPAPLSDAIKHYLEAQDALDNREYAGINAESYEKLIRCRNASRKDLDAALAAQGGIK